MLNGLKFYLLNTKQIFDWSSKQNIVFEHNSMDEHLYVIFDIFT